MIVEWLGQQLASVELTRMKYSGSDFKFTSQANHMAKLKNLVEMYKQEGFHLQRLYKRRKKDVNGIYRSTMGELMGDKVKKSINSSSSGGSDNQDGCCNCEDEIEETLDSIMVINGNDAN